MIQQKDPKSQRALAPEAVVTVQGENDRAADVTPVWWLGEGVPHEQILVWERPSDDWAGVPNDDWGD